jgi:hypothetical protein
VGEEGRSGGFGLAFELSQENMLKIFENLLSRKER